MTQPWIYNPTEAETVNNLQPLARRLAARYRGWDDYEDLVSVASLGILEAARTYDPSKGTTLHTHAYNQARFALKKHVERDCGQCLSAEGTMIPALPRAEGVDVTLQIDPNDFQVAVERRIALERALLSLNDAQRHMFLEMVVQKRTAPELASCLGICHQRVYQVKNAALRKMRQYLRAQGFDANDF